MIIYLSGPITLNNTATPRQISFYKKKFISEQERLEKLGYTIISPIRLESSDKSWEGYMKVCIEAMVRADLVAILPDYNLSKGARLEINLARVLKIKVKKVELIV